MIIGVSSKRSADKNTVGNIIKLLVYNDTRSKASNNKDVSLSDFLKLDNSMHQLTNWQIKKFNDKLKDILCILINCTKAQLRNIDFKNTELGEDWWYYRRYIGNDHKAKPYYELISLYDYNNIKEDSKMFLSLYKLTPRLLSHLIGTKCGIDIIHPNIWINALMSEYKPLVSVSFAIMDLGMNNSQLEKKGQTIPIEYPNWIITDMRFPNELEAVKQKNGITIRVNRNIVKPIFIFEEPADNEHKSKYIAGFGSYKPEHVSETTLDNATFDYIIDNNDKIEELIEKIKEILIKEKIISI